jgi:PAS domain S-box-containing protein
LNARVTIVDDHREFRELLTELLTDGGYEVSALSGEQTPVAEIVATRPDLLILDLNFPGSPEPVSGWDYLKLLRSHPGFGSTPVLICSGDLVALRERSQELGRDAQLAVMAKPFGLDQIEQIVGELINARRVPVWDDERELVLVADAAANLVDASKAALRTLGVSLEELRSRRVADIVARDADWTDAEWQRYIEARIWEGPVSLRRADGSQFEANASAEIWSGGGAEWHISRLHLTNAAAPLPTS